MNNIHSRDFQNLKQIFARQKWHAAAILIYSAYSLNWFSRRYGIGGVVFEHEGIRLLTDILAFGLPLVWLITIIPKPSMNKGIKVILIVSILLLVLVSHKQFNQISLVSDRIIGDRLRIKVFEDSGTAIDMPTRYEESETLLLPGIKWVKLGRSWYGMDNNAAVRQ